MNRRDKRHWQKYGEKVRRDLEREIFLEEVAKPLPRTFFERLRNWFYHRPSMAQKKMAELDKIEKHFKINKYEAINGTDSKDSTWQGYFRSFIDALFRPFKGKGV